MLHIVRGVGASDPARRRPTASKEQGCCNRNANARSRLVARIKSAGCEGRRDCGCRASAIDGRTVSAADLIEVISGQARTGTAKNKPFPNRNLSPPNRIAHPSDLMRRPHPMSRSRYTSRSRAKRAFFWMYSKRSRGGGPSAFRPISGALEFLVRCFDRRRVGLGRQGHAQQGRVAGSIVVAQIARRHLAETLEAADFDLAACR